MAGKTINSRMKFTRDTSANWVQNNPVLLNGEVILVDTDAGELRAKVGDGTKTYTQLPFSDEALKNNIMNNIKVDDSFSDTSTNAVQNKVVSVAIGEIFNLIGDTSVSTQIANATADMAAKDHTHDYAASIHEHTADEVGADPEGSAASALTSANSYTDEKIAEIATHSHDVATQSTDGFMSSTDKSKLDGLTIAVTTTGSGAAYTATVPGITSLTVGTSFIMIPHVTSTSTTPTLNVNGLGAKNIRRRLSSLATSLQAGYSANWLAVNMPFRVIYDGSAWIVENTLKPAAADLYGDVPITKVSGITISTTKLTEGVSELADGEIYLVYKV